MDKSIVAKLTDIVKKHQFDILLGIGVVLISFASFAIGYLVAKEQFKEPIRIEQTKTGQYE